MKVINAAQLLVLIAIPFALWAEQDSISNKHYHFNYWIDLPISAGGYIYNYYGQIALKEKPILDLETINSLDPMDVPGFDRIATRQDPEVAQNAHKISNFG